MVDLVKIRKKAKERPEDGGQKPDVAPSPDVPATKEPATPKKTVERRPPSDEASSAQRAASSAPAKAKQQSKGVIAEARPGAATASDQRLPGTEQPTPSADSPTSDPRAPTSAKSISKLERYKEQAGKRREKAESVARTSAGVATADEAQLELLTFVIAGESYAIEIDNIVEIVPPRGATKVPNASASIMGIISLRGTIVTLIDVRRRLKHTTAEATPETRIIVLEHQGETVGFEVDRVFRVVKIAASEVEPHPVVHASEQDESIRGVFRHGESLTILLDFAKLLGGREVAQPGPRKAVTASRR